MSKIRLSRGQAEVLAEMQRCARHYPNDPRSTPEISRKLKKRFDDWARDKLKRLADHGLVERTGESWSGGHCWLLTEAGRQFVPTPSTAAHGATP